MFFYHYKLASTKTYEITRINMLRSCPLPVLQFGGSVSGWYQSLSGILIHSSLLHFFNCMWSVSMNMCFNPTFFWNRKGPCESSSRTDLIFIWINCIRVRIWLHVLIIGVNQIHIIHTRDPRSGIWRRVSRDSPPTRNPYKDIRLDHVVQTLETYPAIGRHHLQCKRLKVIC